MIGALARRWQSWRDPRRPVPQALWQQTLQGLPFLHGLSPYELQALRALSEGFLARKEFSGAAGLQPSDEMAVSVAVQACLPLLHLGPPGQALRWYDDFVGIVLHPAEMLAAREVTDEDGIVHRYRERLAGEAMDGGPITLNWGDVADAGRTAAEGYNVVIHEFAHKLDLRDGTLDGCPPMPRARRRHWQAVMQGSFAAFCEHAQRARRFPGLCEPAWLDDYAATAIEEFFAVSLEAYFVARERLEQHHPELVALYDGFFRATR